MSERMLSFTEIDTALTCWARWDYAYGGHLAGSTLKEKALAPILSEGRAWGAAAAAWHRSAASKTTALWEAHLALMESLDDDAKAMTDAGFPPDPVLQGEVHERLASMLDHYAETTEPLPNLTRLEEEIVVSIPSRKGGRSSTKYKFLCYLDGWCDDDGKRWVVEFKLRKQLTPVRVVQLSRQVRWYSWAVGKQSGVEPFGVYVDERLNAAPHDARMLKPGKDGLPKVSHAADQMTTPALYVQACADAMTEPKQEVIDKLASRQWQQRIPLVFTKNELAEAGSDLVSAGKLIRDLDSGALDPIRHAGKMTCGGCRYRDICSDPTSEYVTMQFDRGVPKRLRETGDRSR